MFNGILKIYPFLLWVPLAVSIYILAVIWKEYRTRKKLDFKNLLTKILVVLTANLIFLAIIVLIRYEFYKLDAFAKYYLIPEVGYFARIAQRYSLEFLYSILSASVIAILFLVIRKLSHGTSLDSAEVALGFLGGFLAGWQNGLYLVLTIFVLAVGGYILQKPPRDKIVLYPYIIFSSFAWALWQNYNLIVLKRFFS